MGSPFHCVAIRPRKTCPAAEALGDRRYLSDEAPRLPLEACHRQQNCRCIYVHFEDRRQDLRRDADIGLPGGGRGEERRAGRGRRRDDRAG